MQDTLIIDVREPDEFKSFHIKESVHAPLSNPNINLENIIKNSKQNKIILMCLSGRRAQMAKETLQNSFGKEIIVYEGGISKWRLENEIVSYEEENKTKINVPSINRQVQILVGFILIILNTLSLLNMNILFLSLFIGLGLLYSGISDSCMMAMLLNKMPWNKKG